MSIKNLKKYENFLISEQIIKNYPMKIDKYS